MKELIREVKEGNKRISKLGLSILTWGNLSSIDREKGLVAIKPSGVDFEDITDDDICVVDANGKRVAGERRPSSDLATHLEIYRRFKNVGAIVHTRSPYATAFCQAGKPIVCLGTTHADHFYGEIPVTRSMTPEEVKEDYELQTGRIIAETFEKNNINYEYCPGCLVAYHGPFVWGNSVKDALENAVILEEIAKMNLLTLLAGEASRIPDYLLDKHFLRKHGKDAYYGQGKQDD